MTGGAGFIGSHLVDLLIESGHEVLVIDNESADLNEAFHWNDQASNYKFDIVNYESIRPLFESVDFVFHLAAESRLQPAILNPIEAVQKNVLGTAVVLQCARESRVKRFVYSSTSSAYGLNETPNREDQPDDCLNPYSLSKFCGEKLCKLYSDLFDLDTITFRYFNVYGERSPAGGQYAPVIGIFLEQYEDGQPLTVVGDGNQRRDFVYVKDVAMANLLAVTKPLPASSFGEVFNVGSGYNVSVLELAHILSRNIKFLEKRPGEVESNLASIDKIRAVLGWEPAMDVRDWLSDAKRAVDAR